MAWVGQCRVAFKANAEAILWKQKGKKKISPVLRQLSEESGIPFGTLKRWWHEQEREKFKNEPNADYQIKSNPSNSKSPKAPKFQHPICSTCGERKVERYRQPNGEWYYRDKCRKCRKISEPAYQAVADIGVICPLCGGRFKLKKEDLAYE